MVNCTECQHYDVCDRCGRTKHRNRCGAFKQIPAEKKPKKKREVVFYNTGRGGYYWYADE